MTNTIDGALRQAEQRRCKALLDNDMEAMAGLLDDRLHYVHASGAIDDKASLLVPMREGRVRYLAITWDEQATIQLGPDAGIVHGRFSARVRSAGVEHSVTLLHMGVWARDAQGWKLVGYQTTLPT